MDTERIYYRAGTESLDVIHIKFTQEGRDSTMETQLQLQKNLGLNLNESAWNRDETLDSKQSNFKHV